MPFVARLVRNLALALVFANGIAWLVGELVFPLSSFQVSIVRAGLPVAALVETLVVGLAVAALARPLLRASARRDALPEALAVEAAAAGHRIPPAVSVIVLALGLAASFAIVGALRANGAARDIAWAALAVGIAATIDGAMLAYSIAAAALAPVIEWLGPRVEVAAQGTVRGKILVVGLGVNTVALLVFAAAGYARYRVDADRELVASALRAQQAALAAPGERADAEVAERVWLATSAPTALLDEAGTIATRFGHGPFDRATGGPGVARLEAPAGWILRARAPGGGIVATWLDEEVLAERRAGFFRALAVMGAIVYAAAAALAWVAARAITLPFRTLGRSADRIASGDLTASPPSISRDEMGQLAADFRRMAQGLKGLVLDVQAASEGVSLGAREAGAIGERVRTGALDQHQGVVAVQGAVEAMEESIALVSRGVSGLSDYVSSAKGAVGEMAASFEDVRRHGAELERAMGTAASDVEGLAQAGREAESTLGELQSLAGHAGGTLSTARASMAALERAASESESTAATIAEMSERAGGVVEETAHGIDALRAAVSDAHRRVAALGRRSDDIDQVVDFISEVAGRTNLLSLNASIIAAGAGEHGKAFSVVADQIRDLAAQIARSTRSIGDIVHAVREDVEATAALIDRGDALAAEGVQLARNSLEALAHIQRSTRGGTETAVAIRAAVETHAESSREVARLVESITDGTRAGTAAVQLVGRSVAAVGSISRSVGATADEIAHALADQSSHGMRQLDSLARLERMIGELTRAVETHGAAARGVREAIRRLSDGTGNHEAAVEGLAGVADRLGSRARALAERVGRFKV